MFCFGLFSRGLYVKKYSTYSTTLFKKKFVVVLIVRSFGFRNSSYNSSATLSYQCMWCCSVYLGKTTAATRTAMPNPTTTGDALPFTWIKTTVAARTAMPNPTTTGDALPFTWIKTTVAARTAMPNPTTTGDRIGHCCSCGYCRLYPGKRQSITCSGALPFTWIKTTAATRPAIPNPTSV